MSLGAIAVESNTPAVLRAVCKTSLLFLFFAIANVRPNEHCISALTSRASSEQQGDMCLFPCLNEVQFAQQDQRRFDICYHARIKSTLCRTYFQRFAFDVCPRPNCNCDSAVITVFACNCNCNFHCLLCNLATKIIMYVYVRNCCIILTFRQKMAR